MHIKRCGHQCDVHVERCGHQCNVHVERCGHRCNDGLALILVPDPTDVAADVLHHHIASVLWCDSLMR